MNKFGFCIGNGESRKNFNLLNLKPLGEIYGSNAVHRDNDVDYLVCCDRRMVSEVLLNKKMTENTITYIKTHTIMKALIIMQ